MSDATMLPEMADRLFSDLMADGAFLSDGGTS